MREVFIPDFPKDYNANDIKNLRVKLRITQKELASWLNVSLNTVQAWEQGKRQPSHSSLRLLEIFDKDFSLIEKTLKNKGLKQYPHRRSTNSSHEARRSRICFKRSNGFICSLITPFTYFS